jgi:hypothetical protein
MAANKSRRGYRDIVMTILGDGEWHPFTQIFYALESRIPPEDATRVVDRARQEVPGDVESRIRMGREMIVVATLSDMSFEQQGFRNDRRNRKYRWHPNAANASEMYRDGARIAFRALVAQPAVKECFEHLVKIASGEGDLMTSLNPAQEYWLKFALEPDADTTTKAFEEEPDGHAERSS